MPAQTQPRKTQAKKTTQAAKRTARAAKTTSREGKATTEQAERTVRTFVTDSAYAALGVGDTAVGILKGIPGQVERFRKETPKSVETGVKDVEHRVRSLWTDTPEELRSRLEAVRKDAEKEFDAYAERGRSVYESVRRSAPTRRAVEQSKAARSQVKAATTSVRKALGQSVEAVEAAADKIGDEQRAG
jgi:hypothetical protein